MELLPNGWWPYLAGGLLAGAGTGAVFLLTGLRAGASSVFTSTWSWVSGCVYFQRPVFRQARIWRLVFAAGLVAGASAFALGSDQDFVTRVAPWRLLVGGLLVGFGTRLSRGCTSGHGICGLSAGSKASLVAVLLFMGVAIVVAQACARGGGHAVRLFWVFVGGGVFGFGLALSGMTKPEVVLSFLNFEDLGLALVMAGAIAVTAAAFHAGPRVVARPPYGAYAPAGGRLRRSTVVGAVLFGLGWGVAGICPGAMLASLGTGNWPILIGIAGAFAGAYLQGRFAPED